ncbi:Gfo/Idh/MocA family oxidoreductase [Curtobacterium sp. 1P10AnD]|uniref:Gfo/Idh/MocA family protein n=1 Tax=Curtobacterium sp. 1P10AnD TaxID=3132283 RepID=UPI00399FDBCE
MISIAMVGAGQFAPQFAKLFKLHPDVDRVFVADLVEDRASALVAEQHLDGTFPDFESALASDVDAVAIFTQRWTHGPLVVQALRAGKHVYSAVPMAISVDEIRDVIDTVRETGLTYMMGETSYYNPATVFARKKVAEGAFGRVFYAEGDYVHDMDLGFYAAYQYSGGEDWKRTASYPPMLYPTHSVGGVLGAIPGHAVSVSCIGVKDDRGDGVFDKDVSQFDNDFSNATALFELDNGGVVRINEMRRVGYPSHIRESRFRYFGTEGSFEQLAKVSVWQDKQDSVDISDQIDTQATMSLDDPRLAGVDPSLRDAFVSGYAPVHDTSRLPSEYDGVPTGHEGSHQFLADDFVRAVVDRTLPPVNAWTAARFTLPGIIAHQSALQGGVRLDVPDFGDAPETVDAGAPASAAGSTEVAGATGSVSAAPSGDRSPAV